MDWLSVVILVLLPAIFLSIAAGILFHNNQPVCKVKWSDSNVFSVPLGVPKLIDFSFPNQTMMLYCGMPSERLFTISHGRNLSMLSANIYCPIDLRVLEMGGKRYSVVEVKPTQLTLQLAEDEQKRGLFS